jgi:hypothetical protein
VGRVVAIGKLFFKTSRIRSVEPPLQTFFIVVDIINKINNKWKEGKEKTHWNNKCNVKSKQIAPAQHIKQKKTKKIWNMQNQNKRIQKLAQIK